MVALIQAGTSALLIAFGSALVLSYGSDAQPFWSMFAGGVTITICWYYAHTLPVTWRLPEFWLAPIAGIWAPVFAWPHDLRWPVIGSVLALIGVGISGLWQNVARHRQNVEARRTREKLLESDFLDHVRGTLAIVASDEAVRANANLSALYESQRIVKHADVELRGVLNRIQLAAHERDTINWLFGQMDDAYQHLQRMTVQHDQLNVDYFAACERAAERSSSAFPHATISVDPTMRFASTNVSPLGTVVLEDSSVRGRFVGGVEGLELCIASLVRTAVKAGALKVQLRAHHTNRITAVEITDDGPGIPQDVVESLRHMDGRQHTTLWTCKRMALACGGDLHYHPMLLGTRVEIVVDKVGDWPRTPIGWDGTALDTPDLSDLWIDDEDTPSGLVHKAGKE